MCRKGGKKEAHDRDNFVGLENDKRSGKKKKIIILA